MKKLFAGTIFIITLCLLFTGTFLFLKKKPEQNTVRTKNNKDSFSIPYIVKDFKGNVAVFTKNAEDRPLKITKVFTERLPEKDQTILKNGIEVENQSELNSLLEDLCS